MKKEDNLICKTEVTETAGFGKNIFSLIANVNPE